MPRYEVKIPGRGTFEVESPEPLTDQQAYAAALQQIQAGKVEKPASGILGALGKGFESSVSAARAGIKGLIAPEEAAEEAKARGEDIGRRYAEQVSLEKVKKAYEERGLLPAAGEAISQIPYAIAEQAPNIAATLAGGRLGAMAGAPFGPAGVIGGALVGAATPSLFQQAGGNIQRQAEEAIARGETPEINRLAAYGTGAVQAGLDVAGTLIPLGRSLVGKAFGPAVERALAKGAEEGAEKLAKETLLKTLAKGTAVGALAELPTEITQQMLERAQAGLPVLSEDALAEYGETAYQVGLLAPIGAAGRVVERSQARDIVEQRTLSKQARERQAERAKLAEQEAQQEQFKQTDEYALKFVTDHDALQQEYDDNAAVLKKKLPPGSSFADRQTFDDLKKRQKELKEQLQSQAAEYNKLLPKVQGLRDAEAQQKAQLAAQQEQAALAEQQARMREEQLAGPMQQQVLPGMEPPTLREPQEEVTPEQSRARALGIAQQRQEIEKLLEDNQQAQSDAVEKGDFDLRRRLAGQRTALQSELNYLNTQLKKAGVYTDEIAKAQKLQAQLDKARQDLKNMSGPGFDPAAADKLDAKIQKLEEELSQYGGVQQALDLGAPQPLKGLPPQEARADYGARVYKPGAADIEAQEAALREEEARAEEERLAEERRAQKVAPEQVALRRIGERYASPTAVGRGQISSEVDQIVESILERQQPAFAGQVVAGEGVRIVDRGDALRAQLAYARVTNNKERIEELKKRLADLNEPETEVVGEAPALGATARQAGVEGRETPETRAADQVTRLSQSQLVAYDRLSNFINTVREREVPSDETRVRTLKEGAYRMRDTVVGLALNEADARLAQVGRPGLTTDQQLQLVAALERPLNELIQRGALALMPPVAQSAQMRGTRIVMGAKESQTGKRLFGSFPAASNTIRAQIRSVIDKAIGARAPKEKGKPVKAEGLRVQFAATAKERSEEQLFKEAYAEATDAEARELERIQKRLPYVDNQFVRSAIMDAVRDKANGKALTLDDKSQQALTALDRAVQDEGAQAELFPGETAKAVTRTTPGKFQRFLDSAEVARLRAKQAEYNKQAAMMAKRAASIEARIEAERKAADDYVNSLTAGKAKTPAEAAERALQTAVDKNAEAVRIADAINKRRMEERARIAAMIVELERGKTVAQKKVDELAELGEYLSNQMLIKPTDKKIEAAAKDLDNKFKKAVKDYQAVIAATDKAKALQTKILEAHANDTIDNSLIRAGAKAQERIDKARTELSAAREAEGEARRAVEAVQKAQVSETEEQRRQRALLYPSTGVRRTVVVRDTSDPAVQTTINNYRGIIAKKEEEHVVAIKTLDAARNDVAKAEKELAKARDARKGVTQAQKDLDAAQAEARTAEAAANAIALSIEKTYRNVYAALDNAPLRQFEVASKEDVQAFEQYEESQRRLADAQLKASFAEKGLAEPKTPERRKLGPVAKVQSAAPTTMRTGTEESRAGLTTRGQPVGSRITTVEATEAELKRLNKIVQRSALGDIAAKRAELNQINDQLKFIAANPKGTTRTGNPKLTPKQEEAKRAAEARKRELQAELTKLVEEQKTTVKQAQERKAAGKALRAETRKLARTEAEETGEVSEERKLLRGVEVESPDLTPTQVNSIRNNDVVAALEDIANDKTASELNRAVARRLSTLLEGTRIEIVDGLTDDKGNGVSGAATSKLIQLDAKYGLSQEVLLHEAVHAATERVIQADETKLTREQLIAKRELQALFAAIQNDPGITSKNAKSSLSEFVAEALSNSNLQEQLRGKKWRLSDAWKGIKSIILRLLGIKNPETMLGATLAAVDNLMIPSSQRALMEAPVTSRNLAQKDIAALDDGSNSMKEFASQFAQYIKQKDRTPEDVNRIGMDFLNAMGGTPFDYVAKADPNRLDYKSDTIMSDGKVFDPNNPLHAVEATPTTFVAIRAQQDAALRKKEADAINQNRKEDLRSLIDLLRTNGSYTWPEQALVAKAASRYAVLSTPEGRLRLAEISDNNRHPIAVVSKETANAVIEELRKGKSLKAAFLDGLQRNADANAQRNSTKQGWQKFDQTTKDQRPTLEQLYTEEELEAAFAQFDFEDADQTIEQLIEDGLLPDRRPLMATATLVPDAIENAAIALNNACAGTSWCTGSDVSTARSQIFDGDFYIYYKDGRPEVAVRMYGTDSIGEIRGNTPQQWLTAEQQKIAEDFLRTKEFDNANTYLKELSRKESLIRIIKGDFAVGDSKNYEDFYNETNSAGNSMTMLTGMRLNSVIKDLFKFRALDGYASKMRPEPSAAVIDEVTKGLLELQKLDRSKGYFFHDEIHVLSDGTALINKKYGGGEAKARKTHALNLDVKDVKAVRKLLLDQDNAYLPSLQTVKDLYVAPGKNVFPALTSIDALMLVRDKNDVEINDKAVVNDIIGYVFDGKYSGIDLKGGFYIRSVKGVTGVLKTVPYVKEAEPKTVLVDALTDYTNGIFVAAAKNKGESGWPDDNIHVLAEKANVVVQQKELAFTIPDPSKATTREQKEALRLLQAGLSVLNEFAIRIPQETTEALLNDPDYASTVLEKIRPTRKGAPVRAIMAVKRIIGQAKPKRIPAVTDTFFSFREELEALMIAVGRVESAENITKFFKDINDAKIFKWYSSEFVLPEKLPDLKTPARIADVPPPEELVDVPERPRYAPINPALQGAMGIVDQVVAKQKPISDRVRAASGGFLGAETQLVDRFAGFEKLAKYMPKYQGAQMLYYLRMYDQKMNYTSQSAGNGALQLVPYKRPDGETEYIIESVDGANLRNVVLILRDAKNLVGDVDATSRLFTFYLAAKRAERVGFDKLDISGQVTEAQLRDVVRQVESVKGLKEIFESARDEYNQYNADQIRFMVQAGVMNQEEANRLLKAKDYIPWYRSRNGVVEMMIGGETPFKVGNIKDTPHLEQLVGGSEPILDFMVSSVQNTNMLVDMALNNIAKRNAVIELADMGAAIITPKPTSGRDVIKFKYHGEDRYAILQTEQIKIGDKVIDTGVPADLLVKGMEGIPLQVSGVMRLMSIPTMILRKSVTLNPAQMFRQLFRDTTQAYLAAGSDAAPVLGALKEIGAGTRGVLEKRGITGGQVFTGTAEDISKIMREIAKGGVNATRLLAGLEASAAEVDAATRRSQYNSYIKQGMSQMEATLLALESMNFNKRGASPSVHAANALYPFFNAQIQGINVLYKAMFGQLSPSDRARIKEKLITRATMMIAISLAYAHHMQGDEAYKNATPEQKYFNWFVRIPGVEEPLRIPIPFEPGYIFKALPEALYNRLVAKTAAAADEAKGAMLAVLRNVIPGASNWFVPQAIATPVQIGANYSFFQGRSILSKREQELLPEQQYRDNTTELAKLFGGATGISPIMFEEAVRGYFAGLGLATLQIASLPITPKEGPEKATKRMSQMPVVGALFQPNDAGWIINNTYDTLDEARKTQRTVTELINRGEIAQARALMEERKSDYVRAELEGYYRQEMGQLTQLEAAIRASSKTPDEKREFLDRVRQYKIKLAAMVRDASDKTKLQADLS